MQLEDAARHRLERVVKAYVEECSARRTPARVSELAQRFEMSASYFSRTASHVLGRQLRVALRDEQMAIAERLLRTTSLHVVEIAALAALGTPSTFYRALPRPSGNLGQRRRVCDLSLLNNAPRRRPPRLVLEAHTAFFRGLSNRTQMSSQHYDEQMRTDPTAET